MHIKKFLLIPLFAVVCTFARIDSATATDYPFSVTTTSLTANSTVKFQMATKGTFYVDCGSGGTLSGTGVSGTTITQSSATATVYTCTYSTAGTKTIQFGGLATGYSSSAADISTSTLTFWVGSDDTERAANATKIASISGCLGTVFPTLGSSNTSQPTFYASFRNTNITSIPSNLFNGVTGERESMFSWTFRGTKITSIPGNLFSGVSGCGDAKFNSTFRDCTSLTAIPDGLFSGINCSYNYMFGNTFNGDSGLTGYIPPSAFSGLINAGHPKANNMFAYTFGGTNLVSSCPSGTTQYITGYEGSGTQTWDGKVSCQPAGPVTITYSCGSGSGTAPTDSNSPYLSGTSVTTLSNTCTPPNGQIFDKWDCGGTNVNAGSTFTILDNTVCTAQYTVPGAVELNWYDNGTKINGTAYCTVGGVFLPPTPPARTGYVFNGWKIKNVPTGYTQLEYLQSSGTQYINTAVYFDASKDFRIVGDVINPNTSYRKVIAGNWNGDNSVQYTVEFGGSSNSKPGYFRNYLSNSSLTTDKFANSASPVNTLISYDSNYTASNHTMSNSITANGSTQTYSFSTVSLSGSATRPFRLFLDYRSSPGSIAYPLLIGRTKMYKDGTLAGDYIPVRRDSDNVLGMWDKVTKTFFTNSGSGTFTAGPNVQ